MNDATCPAPGLTVSLSPPLPFTPDVGSTVPAPAGGFALVNMAVPAGNAPSSKLNSAVGVGSFTEITVRRATRLVSVLLAAVAIRRKSVPDAAVVTAGVAKLPLVAPGMLVNVVAPGARADRKSVV